MLLHGKISENGFEPKKMESEKQKCDQFKTGIYQSKSNSLKKKVNITYLPTVESKVKLNVMDTIAVD